MMSHGSGKCAIRRAACGHVDISSTEAAVSVAGPRASEAEIDFAGTAIDPNRLIARQRACRPIMGHAGYVKSGMIDQSSAKLVHGTGVRDHHNIIIKMPAYLLSTG
jgi:hypothetical protein